MLCFVLEVVLGVRVLRTRHGVYSTRPQRRPALSKLGRDGRDLMAPLYGCPSRGFVCLSMDRYIR